MQRTKVATIMTMRAKNFQEDLYKALRRHRGAMNEVARRANVHRNSIQRILMGKWENPEVMKIAAEVLREREEHRVTVMRETREIVFQALAMN